jgi:probable addiction module antidote protein
MTLDMKPFDPAEVLTTEGRISAYLEEAFADGDPAIIALALGDVARARNIGALAKQTGLTRMALYKALSAEGNPRLSTLMAVVKALGYQLSISLACREPENQP